MFDSQKGLADMPLGEDPSGSSSDDPWERGDGGVWGGDMEWGAFSTLAMHGGVFEWLEGAGRMARPPGHHCVV